MSMGSDADGGGTSTTCIVLDAETHRELGRSISGSSNRNSVGEEQAIQAVRESIDGEQLVGSSVSRIYWLHAADPHCGSVPR